MGAQTSPAQFCFAFSRLHFASGAFQWWTGHDLLFRKFPGTAQVVQLGDKVKEAMLRCFGHVQKRDGGEQRMLNMGVECSVY